MDGHDPTIFVSIPSYRDPECQQLCSKDTKPGQFQFKLIFREAGSSDSGSGTMGCAARRTVPASAQAGLNVEHQRGSISPPRIMSGSVLPGL